MPASTKDARRLTGYNDNSQPLYDDDMEEYQHYTHEDVYDEYDEDLDDVLGNKSLRDDDDDDDDMDDDTGSELSIPDPNIDFDMVYALHTFAATVEGQASVVRGDALTLLDDSNSYWWLVKVLKTAEVGYIPAENIETPHERLARLNSHRNIELTRKDIQDAFPIPPSNKINNKRSKRVTLAKGVQFQSQIIFGSSDDDEDEFFESQFEEWDERMQSDETDTDEDEDSDDPYNYYDHDSNIRQSFTDNSQNYNYYTEDRLSGDSDIINDREPNARDTLVLDEDTIKISLTPSIARDEHNSSNNSNSSSSSRARKTASKLEKLWGSSEPEQGQDQEERRGSKDSNNSKKEKTGIRKFFSRNSKIKTTEQKRTSGGSQFETASISSQSTGMSSIQASSVERERTGSLDSTTALFMQGTQLKIHAGNINQFINSSGLVESYKFVTVYPTTTATELIQISLQDEQQMYDQEATYHDFYLIVRTLGGDEFTLVPTDKPLEIFHSLTAHLNTPMPSLKKARRISQLMGTDNGTHMGGPNKDNLIDEEEQVQFYLLSKTKRVDEGEIQIKVTLFPSHTQMKRVDKLVKVPSTILIQDAIGLLLEKFHILNGVVAGSNQQDIKSLRLEERSEQDIVKYHLAVNKDGQEHLLDLEEKLINVFDDDQIPHIHYRRNSNPDRTSITVNINPPEKDEIYFILKSVEGKKREKPQRQDTPMPRQADTPTLGFDKEAQESYDVLTAEPEEDTVLNQIDEAIQMNSRQKKRPESTESNLYCNDFGMNDLMVIIRGAAVVTEQNKTIRSEISEVFKDSHTRLDQLEKELDRLMFEAVKVYH